MIKHKKGPRRKQAAWNPVSVAKHIGRDWKTMTTDDRRLLSDACRFFFNQHDRIERYRMAVKLDTPEKSS